MPNFTKKWMPDKGSWEPHWNSPSTEQLEAVLDAMAQLHPEVRDFLDALGSVSVTGMRPNKTGRKVEVRLRLAGRPVKISLFPAEGRSKRSRTRDSVIREAGILLMKKYGRPNLYGRIRERALEKMKESAGHPILNSSYMEPAIADFLSVAFEALASPPPPSDGLDDLFARLRAMAEGGEVDAAFDRHQGGRALEQFQEMAVHAMGHGVRIEDLHAALDEALVKVTMES